LPSVDPAELADALGQGFQQATAEKVYRLLGILRELQSQRSTKDCFTLKGGTALNVFHWSDVPRLSVDIDLMATGFPAASAGSSEHDEVVERITRLVSRLGYEVTPEPSPAACSLTCGYRNGLGSPDRISIDLDLLNRQTLLPTTDRSGPRLFGADGLDFPVVAQAELLGQKLTAVAYRAAPRDLFDMNRMLLARWHELPRARACYLAYSFLQDHEWYRLAYPTLLKVPYRPNQLEDVLRGSEHAPDLPSIRMVAKNSLEGTGLSYTHPTAAEEVSRRELLGGDLAAFADIAGELDPGRRTTLSRHPGLAWRLQQASAGSP
jgi:predicted nucleotidyltransferase component of viral defense system